MCKLQKLAKGRTQAQGILRHHLTPCNSLIKIYDIWYIYIYIKQDQSIIHRWLYQRLHQVYEQWGPNGFLCTWLFAVPGSPNNKTLMSPCKWRAKVTWWMENEQVVEPPGSLPRNRFPLGSNLRDPPKSWPKKESTTQGKQIIVKVCFLICSLAQLNFTILRNWTYHIFDLALSQ